MAEDEIRRAELARLGVARGGIARGGLARAGYTPTPDELNKRLLVEHAEFREQLAQIRAANLKLQTQIDAINAQLSSGRREGGRNSKKKARQTLAKLIQQVDAAREKLTQQGKRSTNIEAAKHVYRTTRSEWWNTLTAIEREREASNLARRCRRGRSAPKKS